MKNKIYLVNGKYFAELKDLAKSLGKTPNALRVAFHRSKRKDPENIIIYGQRVEEKTTQDLITKWINQAKQNENP